MCFYLFSVVLKKSNNGVTDINPGTETVFC